MRSSLARRGHVVGGEVRRTLGILLLTAFVELALLVRLPLPKLAGLLGAPFRSGSALVAPEVPVRVPRWAWNELRSVNRVLSRWPFGDTCLRRCLVAGHRLRGLQPELVIGVVRLDAGVVAHSWLEVGGLSLDPSSQDYAVLQ